jgi:ubiquinone/menaquinone biosynthesis C-methylase UbiE
MRIFRQGAGPYALTEAMVGVRLGQRLLYLGAGDPAMFAALAAKSGLTGRAEAVAESEAAATRLTQAAARAGVLVEVVLAVPPTHPTPNATFDVAVVDATGGMALTLSAGDRNALGREVFRSLRPRGRVVVIEREARGLLGAFKPRPAGLDRFHAEGGAAAMLETAGFQPVRLLADKAGERFTEGWKPSA